MTFTPLKRASLVDQLTATISRQCWRVRRYARRSQYVLRGESPRPVFLVGSGRSGTDLLLFCLAQSLDAIAFNEDHPEVFERWKLRDLDAVRATLSRARSRVAFVKSIVETDRTRELLDAFPDSRAVYVVRHYLDTVASRILFFGQAQEKTVEGWIGQDFSRFPLLPNTVKDIAARAWHASPTTATAAAINWFVVNSAYHYLQLGTDRRVFATTYEAVIADPEATLRQLCQFIGIDFLPRMAGEVGRPSGRSPPKEVLGIPIELNDACAVLHASLARSTTKASSQD